jgi:hypothetical protein
MMDMQTGTKGENLSGNYAVAVLQREIFSRSSIAGFLVHKQITGTYDDSEFTGYRYNSVAGLELILPQQIISCRVRHSIISHFIPERG